MNKDVADGLYAHLNTDRGLIVVALEFEKAPMTVANFVGLAEGTLSEKPFYNGLTFHRVIENFMIQGGDPQGTGSGGPGYVFPDEFHPDLLHYRAGSLSMANAGPGTNGSQFFITHTDTPWLDGHHSVFGYVVEGQNVVDAIQQGDHIKDVKIIRKGEKAEAFLVDRESFAELVLAIKQQQEEAIQAQQAKMNEMIASKYPNAKQTPSGLRYVVEKEGVGNQTPKNGTKVTVHYSGSLLNGKIFDSSIQRGQPAQFAVGEVIEGWNEALVTMRKGEKRTLIIPPELGYGEQGYPGVIPPQSYLIFEVELLNF